MKKAYLLTIILPLLTFVSCSLELTKEGLITIMQKEKFEPIMIKEKK